MEKETKETDLLDLLPYSPIVTEYRKHSVVYRSEDGPAGLYVVLDGLVMSTIEGSRRTVLSLHGVESFFGSSCLIPGELRTVRESVYAMQHSRLMSWPYAQIDQFMCQRPGIAKALLVNTVKAIENSAQRIQSFATESIEIRIARTLLMVSKCLGVSTGEVFAMGPMSHDSISELIGTSREITTLFMNRLRRLGYISYSRKGIVVKNDLQEWIDNRGYARRNKAA